MSDDNVPRYETLEDIEDRVNDMLQELYEGGVVRRLYMIQPGSLLDVQRESRRMEENEASTDSG
jgi:hypothetical protein